MRAVHADLAGADPRRDAARALEVARRHVAGEAVGRVVGDPDRVLLVLVGQDREHRPEDLLARDRHVVAHVREHGRPHVVAARRGPPGRPGPPVTSVAPSSMPFWIRPWIFFHCASLTTGPDPRALGGRVAHRDRLGGRLRDRDRLVVARARHEHARGRVARLAAVHRAAHRAAADRRREVGVVEDDVRGLAAELLRRRASRSARPRAPPRCPRASSP